MLFLAKRRNSILRSSLTIMGAFTFLLMNSQLVFAAGELDNTFTTGNGYDGTISSLRLQPDGKIIVTGYEMTNYNGNPVDGISRLNSDGTLDNTFATTGAGFSGSLNTSLLLGDGKIIIGGLFTEYDGAPASRIARLNPDGTLDNTFITGTGFGGEVRRLTLQSDDKILVGSYGVEYDGAPISRISRLNPDGTLDNTFVTGTGFNGFSTPNTIVVQPDEKILVGGDFTSYNGDTVNYMMRLNPDGSLDNTFVTGTGFDGQVITALIQPDEKILVGGSFTEYNGTPISRIARLNPDGTLDNTFSPDPELNNAPFALSIQTDGKIIYASSEIYRLNSNGGIDNTFVTGTNFDSNVLDTVIQTDGKILAGGYFSEYNGTLVNDIVRLNAALLPPDAPLVAPDMTAESDTGSSSTDNITSNNTPTFEGTCTDGETVTLYVDTIAVTPNQVCIGSEYSITLDTPLSIGSYDIQSSFTNDGGISALSPALQITIENSGGSSASGSKRVDIPDGLEFNPSWNTKLLYRLYHPALQNHFYTTNESEKLQAFGYGYRDEGMLGRIMTVKQANNVPMFRFYKVGSENHFYTTNETEARQVIARGYRFEGIVGYLRSDTVHPIYRAYNPDFRNHFYTVNREELNYAVRDLGYKEEAILGSIQ